MNELTNDAENLFRAVRPDAVYWKNGRLSSAAFKDPKGLSVDMQGDRSTEEALETIRHNFIGTVVSVTVGLCREKSIIVHFCPTDNNKYHCEIIHSLERKALTSSQAKHLAKNAIIY